MSDFTQLKVGDQMVYACKGLFTCWEVAEILKGKKYRMVQVWTTTDLNNPREQVWTQDHWDYGSEHWIVLKAGNAPD